MCEIPRALVKQNFGVLLEITRLIDILSVCLRVLVLTVSFAVFISRKNKVPLTNYALE